MPIGAIVYQPATPSLPEFTFSRESDDSVGLERALESGSADELVDVLCASVRDQVTRRHHHAMELETKAGDSVEAAREYVEAVLQRTP